MLVPLPNVLLDAAIKQLSGAEPMMGLIIVMDQCSVRGRTCESTGPTIRNAKALIVRIREQLRRPENRRAPTHWMTAFLPILAWCTAGEEDPCPDCPSDGEQPASSNQFAARGQSHRRLHLGLPRIVHMMPAAKCICSSARCLLS